MMRPTASVAVALSAFSQQQLALPQLVRQHRRSPARIDPRGKSANRNVDGMRRNLAADERMTLEPGQQTARVQPGFLKPKPSSDG